MSRFNIVAHNLPAMFSNRQLGIVSNRKKESTEKLSSGYKINRAADDAAGLAISEKMRRMIRGLTQASANVQDGVSLCQVADGYLNEVHDMLHRITELSIKGSNATLSDSDRQSINEEVGALKDEMRRIFNVANFNEIPLFHVPYTPDILSAPTDMEVFHSGNGGVGGLEFNNVRYNISELQSKGLKIDSSGIATEDFDVSFSLWDGETVDLSMKEGQSVSEATRNYKWTADGNGIYINQKPAAEWSEVIGPNGQPVTDTSSFGTGLYRFTHHGMTVEFSVDEEATLDDIMSGINGDGATQPATWDVKVGGASPVQSADIVSGTRTLTVTNANKNIIDQNYSIVANQNGIAIKRTNPSDPSDTYTTDYVAWATFKDSSKSNIHDENGNVISTNGGYPIVNWGTENDGNGESEITFDGDATYHFKSPDNNAPISFDFKLAESTSLAEVMTALNGASVNMPNVSAPGSLSSGSSTSYGSIGVGSTRTLANDFALQRAYGRDFDNANATLTANITVERSTIAGQPSEADRPNATGGYDGNTHVVSRELTSRVLEGTTEETSPNGSHPMYVYIQPEKYTDYSLDEFGNKIPKTNDLGEPVTDESGNPIYETQEYVRWHIYEEYDHYYNDTYTDTYNATDTWSQNVKYSFDGTTNGHEMNDVERTQKEYYSRNLVQIRTETVRRRIIEVNEVDDSSMDAYVKSFLDANPQFFENPDTAFSENVEIPDGMSSVNFVAIRAQGYNPPTGYLDGRETVYNPVYGDYSTPESGIGDAALTSIGTGTFSNIAFKTSESNVTGSKNAFTFNYALNLEQARNLVSASSAQQIGTITFRASNKATRDYTPIENANLISEAEFTDITINIPTKKLDIQAGANAGEFIRMEWSPLSLTIIGMSGANTLTQESSQATIGMVKKALDIISETRSTFGSYQNRFEHTIKNLDNTVENTQAAESLIRDTEMAQETVKNAKENILEQVGHSLLAQANQSAENVLSLLK